MKKKLITLMALTLAFAMVLSGCGSKDDKDYSFTIDSTNDNTIEIKANDAEKKSGGIGYITARKILIVSKIMKI